MFVGFEPHFLHHVDLGIARWSLNPGVFVGYHHIHAVLTFYIERAQKFIGTKTPLLQVAVIVGSNAGDKSPFFPPYIDIKMPRFFIICGSISGYGFTRHVGFFVHRKFGYQGLKTHNTTNGVAPVNNGIGAKEYFGSFGGKGI